MELRVATFNVKGFRAGIERVAGVVGHMRPDVLLLQETGPRRSLGGFSSKTQMQIAEDPPARFRRRVKDAVAVRSPWKITSSSQHRFAHSSLLYPRGAMFAEVEGPDGLRIRVASVHLGLSASERGRHIRELLALIEGSDGSLIAGGDFNATPEGSSMRKFAERLSDVWPRAGVGSGVSLPAEGARIDYLFVSSRFEISEARVEQTDASDHLPVLVDLRL